MNSLHYCQLVHTYHRLQKMVPLDHFDRSHENLLKTFLYYQLEFLPLLNAFLVDVSQGNKSKTLMNFLYLRYPNHFVPLFLAINIQYIFQPHFYEASIHYNSNILDMIQLYLPLQHSSNYFRLILLLLSS